MRPAEPSDLTDIERITRAAYAQYLPLLGYPPRPVTEDYRPRIERGEVWLADESGEPIGLIVLERHPDHAMIFSVAVSPEHQGEGHGLALLRFAEEEARGWGVGEVRLYTNGRMERNISLYISIGYRETGRGTHPLRPGFVVVDMAKPLAEVNK